MAARAAFWEAESFGIVWGKLNALRVSDELLGRSGRQPLS